MGAHFYRAPAADTMPHLLPRQSVIRGRSLHETPSMALDCTSLDPATGRANSLLQQRRNRLDAIAGILRQPRANGISGIERAVAGEHLRGHQIAQNGDAFQLLLLFEKIAIDRECDEGAGDRLLGVGWIRLQHREELAELHDLVDMED